MSLAPLPDDLFAGDDAGTAAAKYKSLAKTLHPDTTTVASEKLEKGVAFARLNDLYQKFEISIGAKPAPAVTINTRKRTYVVGEEIAVGDIANLYSCVWAEEGVEQRGVMKMPRSPQDSDLIQREAEALTEMNKSGMPDSLKMYVPTIVERFKHRDKKTAEERQCIVTQELEPDLISLAEVRNHFPSGLPPEHVAWIWRRLLGAVGLAHSCGVIHGAVVPEHVLIGPVSHNVVLVDWCYASVREGQLVPAIVNHRKDLYPDEILNKQDVNEQTDIYMVSKTMEWLAGSKILKGYQAFIKGSAQKQQAARPYDAFALAIEFDELLEQIYGARKYQQLHLPEGK